MVDMYPLCTFRNNPVAASIDTPLHGFLPFPHVDHLHPDWGIALAASANGKAKMEEFNREFDHSLVWIPWQRPGFELGMMMRIAVEENPGCDGIVLGGHGLFTWGETQRECYLNTLTVIDQIGQFIARHGEQKGRFGLAEIVPSRDDRKAGHCRSLPYLRGRVSAQQRWIANFTDAPDVLQFVNSAHAEELAYLGTSCPDHFIRTKIRPLFVPWPKNGTVADLKKQIESSLAEYRDQYRTYYHDFATPDSPAIRDPSPTVVLIPGIGMFSFGKNKTEARIVGEFYTNAIHVIEGATLLSEGEVSGTLPQCGEGMDPASFKVFSNYVALPPIEAFRIEYWAIEEAKLRRQPPEKELSRRIAARRRRGQRHRPRSRAPGRRARRACDDCRPRWPAAVRVRMSSRTSRRRNSSPDSCRHPQPRGDPRSYPRHNCRFGGLDILINTAALFPSSPDGQISDDLWSATLDINVTANYILADEAAKIFDDQDLDVSIVLTSSANAVVPKRGSEAYDVSKAALSHLVRELAVSLAPKVRVNGVSPGNRRERQHDVPTRPCPRITHEVQGPL